MALPRIRPQVLWVVHFLIFFVFLGLLISNVLPFSISEAKGLTVAWVGIVILHTLLAFNAFGSASSEPGNLEEEKPKRHVGLSDDGELVDMDDWVEDEEKPKRLTHE